MFASMLSRLSAVITSVHPVFWVIFSGTVILTVALIVLMRTRWGRSRPLRKCVVLSIYAHLLLLLIAYATTFKQVGAAGPQRGTPAFIVTSVKVVEEPDGKLETPQMKPWQRTPLRSAMPPIEDLARARVEPIRRPLKRNRHEPAAFASNIDATSRSSVSDPVDPEDPRLARNASRIANGSAPAPTRERISVAHPMKQEGVKIRPGESRTNAPSKSPTLLRPATPKPERKRTSTPLQAPSLPRYQTRATPMEPVKHLPGSESVRSENEPISEDAASLADLPGDIEEIEAPAARKSPAFRDQKWQPKLAQRRTDDRIGPSSDPGRANVDASIPRSESQHELPQRYQLRPLERQTAAVRQGGGSPDTEAAVRNALAWMAKNQQRDGRWDAARHGAGKNRFSSGSMRPDTGVTGLALLAFLGAGHTHKNEQDQYKKTVQAALNYLLRIQARDGRLSGPATHFAAMYCHGMATLALAEAYGMTGDPQLREPLRQAVSYTIAAQHKRFGGWRYRSHANWRYDPALRNIDGDTSQLGWQLMALNAAEVAGLEFPAATRRGMIHFLDSVSSGRHGGLASYRRGERYNHTMTAEALFCRFLLGTKPNSPLAAEAGAVILNHLPGGGRPNFYYWYYATLSTYHLQGRYWETWNRAMQNQLLALQQRDGSWSSDTVWGSHGGRVYTTALGTLCLEVYYRYAQEEGRR